MHPEKQSNTDVSESPACLSPIEPNDDVTERQDVALQGKFHSRGTHPSTINNLFSDIFKKLGILDKLLSPLIILFMILGVVTGEFAPHIQQAFDAIDFHGVSVRESTPVRLPKRLPLRF